MKSSAPTLRFMGAAGTVTGSRFLLTTGKTRTLIDCGLFQGLKELRLRNWAKFPIPPQDIDAVLLTHAHIDRDERAGTGASDHAPVVVDLV